MKYRMLNNGQALREFSIIFDFFKGVGSAYYTEILPAIEKIKDKLDLPARMDIQFVKMTLGQIAEQQPLAQAGIGFQRFSKFGAPEATLVCEESSINYTSSVYGGWESTKQTIIPHLIDAARVYSRLVPAIHSVRIQYVNEFECPDPMGQPVELFRKNSKWVSGAILEAKDAWHLHQGLFVVKSPEERELVNVNFDCRQLVRPDKKITNTIRVTLVSGVFYTSPGQKPLVVHPSTIQEAVDTLLERSHSIVKQSMREVFSDSYLDVMDPAK